MIRVASIFCCFFLVSNLFGAEAYNVGGGSYRAMREIDAPTGKAVVVTQFLHQGLINLAPKGADPRSENAGKTVLVTNKAKKPVPFRILQLGPGDYCRIAIQAEERTAGYIVYYGASPEKGPNRDVEVPPWTVEVGLLFEARRVDRPFGMDDVESLKKAFEKSSPIGADYVSTVHHGFNPLTLRREPFLSRYSGTLDVQQPGRYAILTSSHHCSFLSIDGKIVASHPGRHHRSGDARPELVKFVTLTQGPHAFEYWHATGDHSASMLVVWELNAEEKPKKLALIPPEAFHGDAVARVPAGSVRFADLPGSPDFEYRIVGSVPLPDNEQHLIAVQFQNKTIGLAAQGKLTWSFGDGLTGDGNAPGHIFLKPGLYTVQLVSETVSQKMSAVNRIEIDQPHRPSDPNKPPTLDQYLTVLEKYDASKLDPDSLLQLVEAYQAKIDSILNPTREELDAQEAALLAGNETPEPRNRRASAPRIAGTQNEQVAKYRRLIAETVRTALADNPNFRGDHSVYKLTLAAGALARDHLDDWKLAGQIYTAAAKKLTFDDFAAESLALAADVALDMGNKTAAKNYLESAEKKLSKTGAGRSISVFHRVRADYLAETGQGEQARAALEESARAADERGRYAERIALEGSASRSAEKFLQENDLDRAIDSLRTWQLDYPASSLDGFMTLLFAKYWLAREKYQQAAALADRQITLHPDGSYIDELLLTAAEAQEKAGQRDTAKAYLHSILKDHPGSALIPEVRERLAKME